MVRRLIRFADGLAFVAMAPFVIPGIVMAIGFYAAYAWPPLMLYGGALLIIVAFTARFLPMAYARADRVQMEPFERVKMLEKQRHKAGCVNPCERNTL